jgi:hypothetical protein
MSGKQNNLEVRRAAREARSRPWLSGSVLLARSRSPSVATTHSEQEEAERKSSLRLVNDHHRRQWVLKPALKNSGVKGLVVDEPPAPGCLARTHVGSKIPALRWSSPMTARRRKYYGWKYGRQWPATFRKVAWPKQFVAEVRENPRLDRFDGWCDHRACLADGLDACQVDQEDPASSLKVLRWHWLQQQAEGGNWVIPGRHLNPITRADVRDG